MRAIVVSRTGGPEVLVPSSVEPPEPERGQVLVRIQTAGVNFIDTYYRSGAYPADLPFIPGQEGAGTVELVGAPPDNAAPSGAAEFRPGGRVCWASARGSY